MTRWWFAGVVLRRDFEHFLMRWLTTTVSSPYGRCHYIGRRVSYPFLSKSATSTWQRVSVSFLTTQSSPPAAAADQIVVRCEVSANLSTVARFSARLHTQRRTRTRAWTPRRTQTHTRTHARAGAGGHTCWITLKRLLLQNVSSEALTY